MRYLLKELLANPQNYGEKRDTKDIKYLVVHYTANDGDKAINNAKYFANNIVKTSAHYFVDDEFVYQSVPDDYVAWAVGGKRYPASSQNGGARYYGKCTNMNSISIELCDSQANGRYDFTQKTLYNAAELIQMLTPKYHIAFENIIRHFDVTGKICPKPFVEEEKAWIQFKELIKQKNRTKQLKVNLLGVWKEVDAVNIDGSYYCKIRDLEQWGFKVEYQKGQVIISKV